MKVQSITRIIEHYRIYCKFPRLPQGFDESFKMAAAFFVIFILVEGSAGRGEEHYGTSFCIFMGAIYRALHIVAIVHFGYAGELLFYY
jgi:hypothetical protein